MDSHGCKLFVGGISPNTTQKDLIDHFHQYGEVSMSTVFKNRHDQSPRGFGFVTFSDPSAVDAVLANQHVVLGKMVDVKRAIPRSESHQPSSNVVMGGKGHGYSNGQGFTRKKIFVGGLPHDLSVEEFKSYFEQFGGITHAVVMCDEMKRRPRGFGFVTFESEESVADALQNKFHLLKGKRVEVKRAVQKDVMDSINGIKGGRDLQQDCPLFNPVFAGPVPVHPCGPYGPIAYTCWFPMGGLYGVSSLGTNCFPALYGVSGKSMLFCNYPAAAYVNGVGTMTIRDPRPTEAQVVNGHMGLEVETAESVVGDLEIKVAPESIVVDQGSVLEPESVITEIEERETESTCQEFDYSQLNPNNLEILNDRAIELVSTLGINSCFLI